MTKKNDVCKLFLMAIRATINADPELKIDKRYGNASSGWLAPDNKIYKAHPDTEADGVIFCGKCGKEKMG